ncbi:precorrin-2 dehydrogenase/sirohydrochlorin ferrochelatase family protein [Alteriqipengyuania lutimaris]|uniref:precorrin-2 dehydrogenase n=1 Tax=Alteriqipengyuania lutimaris TaxID=1538146 RepID=A0A395LPX5_9SPHN|nr:bifunctional precorrin-2 dehydrogenase/sirohydrochlorin ferrochelatase [Alteriqipengyuania lutimaris]MBB3033344.1 uroporphyrin-III C-methyltransferase/precorrin-2 dehydrogenase/sirohydrochlorin ferrochelatase [Alteriqipengyuania lutimaris]RDS77624.1 bifunctional precorrin-2 dehydrogenase/sirohydrochlorin ferrochelatase [Alteriqipengyuania lutimaris]
MIATLPLFHKVAGTRIVVVGDGEMAAAKRRLVERAGAIPCAETEAHHAALAFVALEDEREAAAVRQNLKAKGLLVNVADKPDLCDFTTPSILDRDPLLIAIGTGGASAGLAKHVRLRLEAVLPQRLGELARKLAAGRDALRGALPDGDARRRAVDAALRSGGTLDVLGDTSADRVEQWLADPAAKSSARIETVVLRSDDPEDLTLRQARWLGEADTIYHAADIAPEILARARADAVRRPLENAPDMPEDGFAVILERA